MGNELHVTADMRRSMEMVEKHKCVIAEMLRMQDIKCVEGDDNEVLRMLDLSCGIDYFGIHRKSGLTWGVASRWQTIHPGQPVWRTFTIRKERESGAATEYEKRKRAIEKNGEFPYLTMQGYVNEQDELMSIGIARTADIIDCIDRGHCYEQHTRSEQKGQASFYVVKWDVMKRQGHTVLIHNEQEV